MAILFLEQRLKKENAMFRIGNIIDDDYSTRWSGKNCEQAFLLLDLKKEYSIIFHL